MKVGEYIRTKYGIGKIIETRIFLEEFEIRVDSNIGKITNVSDNTHWNNREDIIKSSPNIIDLIELGDLVRLFMEDDVDKEDTNIFEVIAITDDKKEIGVFTKDCELDFYPIENLRGIVTSEQFSQMEYRIGE